jgi:probable rRNA maturation factor
VSITLSKVRVRISVAGPYSAAISDEDLPRDAVAAAVEAASRDPDLLPRAVREAPALEVSLRITGDEEMQELNLTYRGVNRPTDVLSFSLLEHADGAPQAARPAAGAESYPALPLGDVVISWSHVERQAAELGHSVRKEAAWLVIHGTLQLLGYSHDSDIDAQRMEAVEQEALAALGL